MKEKRILNIKGTILDRNQLNEYLEKMASDHILSHNSSTDTYPIPRLKENYAFIKATYKLLNEQIKQGIPIHPAGEWVLDNLYIIEEITKSISKELTLKKYTEFLGLANGQYRGFARIYVIACEMCAYTDGKINSENLEQMLTSYQNKKTLSMNEIWNIGTFIQIALIEKIREICESIYLSQIQKDRVEDILSRYFDESESRRRTLNYGKVNLIKTTPMKNAFVEYMSYKLKKYGSKASGYLKILEDEVYKTGSSITEIVKREHYDIAIKKVIIGNCIISLKKISRINFLEIFEKINRVEDILKKDPVAQYEIMDADTKTYYRNSIVEISQKTKISELYIAKKALELSKNEMNNIEEGKESNLKKAHIGYYLVSKGKEELLNILLEKNKRYITNEEKTKIYISSIWVLSVILSIITSLGAGYCINNRLKVLAGGTVWSIVLAIVVFLITIIPIQNIIVKITQYILSKVVKPKLIPKLDFQNGIPESQKTMVVIPSILSNAKKVDELMKKLEVYYLANKSKNLYFTLLGDVTTSSKEKEDFDEEIISKGIEEVQNLNEKYKANIFNFVYRKRTWSDGEECYMGWERKRGLLNQFNEYLLGNTKNPFRINTIEKIEDIKYIITLDADTELSLNSGLELVGAMAHILNQPIMNRTGDAVVLGHALIAPRVGIGLRETRASKFTQIYAGEGGTDSYTNAISDVYQDNFDEGIFTGKGIYDLRVFSKVLNNEIKENTVLSHDLLEGNYLRCALASDIMLMDGFPSSYMSFRTRLYRWTRGDYQILQWLNKKIENKNGVMKNNPLNLLSKYKIFCNIVRSKQETSVFLCFLFVLLMAIILKINLAFIFVIALISVLMPMFLDILNLIISKKNGNVKTKRFVETTDGVKASVLRGLIDLTLVPDKMLIAIKAEIKTAYRMLKSKKHLLEWTTSEEAEKMSKTDCISYYKSMILNTILGIIGVIAGIYGINNLCQSNMNGYEKTNMIMGYSILLLIFSFAWLLAPYLMCKLSKKNNTVCAKEKLLPEERKYLLEVGKRTWLYFKENINEKGNFLPPDNYQEDRKPRIVMRTSSTNIGLALLSIMASYDLKYENFEDTIDLLYKMVNTIINLEKWNGHLYNWYNTETLAPLIPRYISSVDSGNFVGYLYVLKQFLVDKKEKIQGIMQERNTLDEPDRINKKLLEENKENPNNEEKQKFLREENQEKNISTKYIQANVQSENSNLKKIDFMIDAITNLIENTDFKVLYDEENRLFSVGFNVEDGKLTDSYYDLLASEARQASLVAIAKKDISEKHWYNLSRTLTSLNSYKGLISWAGTSFEYLMPSINIPQYPGSILDESCKFMIMSQLEYSKKLGIPFGISEAAFNLKDLNNNYQYKAFGIPWLGLKRGLSDEIVVSSYGSVLAVNEIPKQVIENLKRLETEGMYNTYGFYESIDYTPGRNKNGKQPVKTYMAHHQGLILLSIDNLMNNNIIQKRFMDNPEIKAVSILLEEKMPKNMITTKEEKEKVEKIKYKDYEDYTQREYSKINEYLNISNVIANDKYTIVMDQYGNGYSKYKNLLVNRFKQTDEEEQGIKFYIKNIRNKNLWTNTYSKNMHKPEKYNVIFSPEQDKIIRRDENIETSTKVIVSPDEPLEIRRIELKNFGNTDEILEVTATLEPVISSELQDYSHKAFNNLFLSYEYIENLNTILIKREAHTKAEHDVYMAVCLYTEDAFVLGDSEYEIDKERLVGRCNYGVPTEISNSIPFSKKLGYTLNPLLAMKKTVNVSPEETTVLNLIISVEFDRETAIKNLTRFMNNENIKRTFELLKAKSEAENRYLGIKGKEVELYQKILAYLLFQPKVSLKNMQNLRQDNYNKNLKSFPVEGLWKYGISGDLPILLVKIKDINDIDFIGEILACYEFFRVKNIAVDLVIIDEEKDSYENYVRDAIQTQIFNRNLSYLLNISGGIFCLNDVNDADKVLLEIRANLVFDASESLLKLQMEDLETRITENIKETGYDLVKNNIIEEHSKENKNLENLKYYNDFGGFSEDGKEYNIRINYNHKLPTVWSNILANKNFGTLVTDSMGGYTWNKNSRLNRLTAWSNDQVADVPSEIIYFKDLDTDKKWSLGYNPMHDENDYFVTYGFGYARYIHESSKIEQKDEVFVPKEDSVKINLITLENKNPQKKKLKLIYYIKPVLGEDEIKSNGFIYSYLNRDSNVLFLKNLNFENNEMFVSCSEKITSYTGSKTSFFKESTLKNPIGLDQLELNRENSFGKDGIVAVEIKITLEAFSKKNIVLMLGAYKNKNDALDLAYKYSNISNCKNEFEIVKRYWQELTSKIQVKTPMESTNILLNGWLIYQTIVSRLYARTGFYQSGGAYGFRDQLQDVMLAKYVDESITREQIIRACRHQFIEGDVEHWWHEESGRGIRSRISDDRLWLAYVTADYIKFTGDYSILDEQVSYKKGEILSDFEEERYDLYEDSDIKESLYMHCIRAIEISLDFGEHEIPKIGSGDWNDGMSNIGVKGKGESVWLGFFLYDVLKEFIPICEYKNDIARVEKYQEIMEKLKRALNTKCWDGRWFKRAFTDDGEILGSLQNEECKIDNISQSWAVISSAGDNDKKYIAMESLENHLIDKELGIIKLLDPPFEKSKLDPGYIKSYLPGTRENGGQYTHAGVWTIIAETMLGLNEQAYEHFRMINPIEHSRTKDGSMKYKVEPYVISADVYSKGNLAGRGGWTWYTGSSSWMYIAGIKYILGLNIEKGYMTIKPSVPNEWKEYEIRYRYKQSVYNIKVTNENDDSNIYDRKQIVLCNGDKIEDGKIKLQEKGIFNIEVVCK